MANIMARRRESRVAWAAFVAVIAVGGVAKEKQQTVLSEWSTGGFWGPSLRVDRELINLRVN
jgi:hypothetical protein